MNSLTVDPRFVVEHRGLGKGVVIGLRVNGSGKCLEVIFDGESESRKVPISAKHAILGHSLWKTPVQVLDSINDVYKPPKHNSANKQYANPSQELKDLEAHVETVGADITCECRSDHMDRVVKEYEDVTKTPCDISKIIRVENKPIVPVEWRTTFDAPLSDVVYSYPHDKIRGGGKWRVNYKAFAFYLFSRGFRLGHNEPIKEKL